MKIIWLGHGAFRFEIGDKVLLIDPWIDTNPVFPQEKRAEALAGATHIFITHGHGDHIADVPAIAAELNLPVFGIVELMRWMGAKYDLNCTGFNMGGTIDLGDVKVTMVRALHSNSTEGPEGPIYLGTEAGFVIEGEGHSIYFTGDTDVHADMAVVEGLHKPDIGIMSAGGHFTMDMKRTAYACKTYFDFKTVIPMHYKTFPALEQSAEKLVEALPGVNVIEPEIMSAIEI